MGASVLPQFPLSPNKSPLALCKDFLPDGHFLLISGFTSMGRAEPPTLLLSQGLRTLHSLPIMS